MGSDFFPRGKNPWTVLGELVAKQGCKARVLASQERAPSRCSSPF